MGSNLVTAAIMLLVGFMGGIMAAIVLIVSVASRREERLGGEAGVVGGEPPVTDPEADAPPRWPGGLTG